MTFTHDTAAQLGLGRALASWSLPAWERGRSSEAWRTKKTRMRPAMRSTSAPAKLALGLLGLGLNLDRYSTLKAAHPTRLKP